jgi:hypothetical protein
VSREEKWRRRERGKEQVGYVEEKKKRESGEGEGERERERERGALAVIAINVIKAGI